MQGLKRKRPPACVLSSLYPDANTLRAVLIRLLEGHPLKEPLQSRLAVAEALPDGSGVGRLLTDSRAVLRSGAPDIKSTVTLTQQCSQHEVSTGCGTGPDGTEQTLLNLVRGQES